MLFSGTIKNKTKMKNKLISYLSLMFFVCSLSAQVPIIEDLPRSIKKEHRQDVRKAKRESKKQEREDWDIVIDPIETPVRIPTS